MKNTNNLQEIVSYNLERDLRTNLALLYRGQKIKLTSDNNEVILVHFDDQGFFNFYVERYNDFNEICLRELEFQKPTKSLKVALSYLKIFGLE